MIKSKGRRKFINFVIDPKSLARLSVPFLSLASISIVIVYVIQWKVLTALERTELRGVENIEAMNALHSMQESVTVVGAYGLVILCVASLLLWVVFSHRIFGPTVPIRRHVQNLIAGQYDSRIAPRSSDEFRDLSEDLNRLAEVLGKK